MPDAPAAPPTLSPAHVSPTDRTDNWWKGPLTTFMVLSAFIVYATFRAFHNRHYLVDWPGWGELLSPFYSPLILWESRPAWLSWFSPAMIILPIPAGFRLTCYYYRKAYYRAFFRDPVACAVGETRTSYCGETQFPFILQNLHRYFLYLALVFNVILWIDAIRAFFGPSGFQVTIGTLVLCANAFLLLGYSLSCHSLRHLVGGKVDCFTCVSMGGLRQRLWRGASAMNENHMGWAWTSLFGVMFADFYVWMAASGAISDLRIL